MFQFFVEPEQIEDRKVTIIGSDVNHIKNVLRMNPGTQVRVSDNEGRDFLCEIRAIQQEQILLHIIKPCEGTEPSARITLFQGLPKGDKMEWIIQKAVELGASEIVPVAMQNCVVKLDAKKAEHKRARWQAIAESAAKQSKRSKIPEIRAVCSFQEAAAYAGSMEVRLLPYEQERGMAHTREVFEKIQKGASIGIFIGPEGGFASKEIEAAQGNMEIISLGNRILRTETAGLAVLAMLGYALED
ncbi:MAG: 16S rRNA (uracil(1498)-N(3))-methyltransferase [Lachnospiraceae bacterium]|nr:16S rRNA (uracil(1498)-N(3))-methyltransferase [Lachnospiraceae bacterium]